MLHKQLYHYTLPNNTLSQKLFMYLYLFTLLCTTLLAQSPETIISEKLSIHANDTPEQFRYFPIEPGRQYQKITVHGNNEFAATVGVNEKLVYSNPLGQFILQLFVNNLLADDITLIAPDGCTLSRFTFQVTGRADPEDIGGSYQVEFALYDHCPYVGGKIKRFCQGGPAANQSCTINSNCGGLCLDGIDKGQPCLTSADCTDSSCRLNEDIFICEPNIETVTIPAELADDIITIEYIPPASQTIHLFTNLWLGVKSNRNNCGIIMGAPPLIGYSDDVVDFPGVACSANLGRFPQNPHASFYAEFYVQDDCPDAFTGYRSFDSSEDAFKSGGDITIADDIELGVDSCTLISYEVGVRGPGLYTVELYSDNDGLPGEPISGTDQTTRHLFVQNSNSFRLERFILDSPILIPSKVWMTFKVNNDVGGWVNLERDANWGHTSKFFAIKNDQGWEFAETNNSEFPRYGGFYLSIQCAGEPPVGACCDMYLLDDQGEAVCREIPEINCVFPPRFSALEPAWMEGSACDPNPFPYPCGLSACCTPDDTCENLTKNECDQLEPVADTKLWRLGQYCDEDKQLCPFHACVQREGECMFSHEETGCDNSFCCQSVCEIDRWCCRVEWDTICLRETLDQCSISSPDNDACNNPLELNINSSTVINISHAFSSSFDPGYSCNNLSSGQRGIATTWYTFEATDTSVGISTCHSTPPADDTLLAVYQVGDLSSPESACASLTEIECNDDASACGTGLNSVLCVDNLTIGEIYYVQLAVKTIDHLGVIQMDIESPCPIQPMNTVNTITSNELNSNTKSGNEEHKLSNITINHTQQSNTAFHRESLDDPYQSRSSIPPFGVTARSAAVVRDGFVSVQVNVDANGNNIPGDAANEPSIAIDPTDPNKIVIGWRQFDTVESNFRQAGWAYSHDGGNTWTFTGVLEPEVFRSDPVLAADADGNFYYYSLTDDFTCDLFKSVDGGVSWLDPIPAFGGDKAWITIDRTIGIGRGNIYVSWWSFVIRSTDDGNTFDYNTSVTASWGTLTVSMNGMLYVYARKEVTKSTSARNKLATLEFQEQVHVDLGGGTIAYSGPNPGGLLGQYWIESDHSNSPGRGNLYALASVSSSNTILDVMFSRSTDGGLTWSEAVRVNDDPISEISYQWFGLLAVGLDGRIHAFWNDTRNTGETNLSELYYSYSVDQGRTWSVNIPVSPVFDSWVGWPNQNKIGDYYHAVANSNSVNIAYAATFNGEQDVYFLKIEHEVDCNMNGINDIDDVAQHTSDDCNLNRIPDECDYDFDQDEHPDSCDSDIDNDGILNDVDVCDWTVLGTPVFQDGRPLGDSNGDCGLDHSDYWRFRNCMLGGRLGVPAPEQACRDMFDFNNDTKIDLRDFAQFQNAFGPTDLR